MSVLMFVIVKSLLLTRTFILFRLLVGSKKKGWIKLRKPHMNTYTHVYLYI